MNSMGLGYCNRTKSKKNVPPSKNLLDFWSCISTVVLLIFQYKATIQKLKLCINAH